MPTNTCYQASCVQSPLMFIIAMNSPSTPRASKTPRTPKTSRVSGNATPAAGEVWICYGDVHSRTILLTAKNHTEYENAVGLFHSRLFLIVRGLTADEANEMFTAALPAYLRSATSSKLEKMSIIFDKGQARIETALSVHIRAYAQLWLDSAAGEEYASRYIMAK